MNSLQTANMSEALFIICQLCMYFVIIQLNKLREKNYFTVF